jgi:3-hydroxyisobutyrate dehydrogenase
MNIGYVGLGTMGSRLSRHLYDKHTVLVYDLDAAAVKRQCALGAHACESLPDITRQCDVILLCLPTSDHVQQAVFGPNGLSAGARQGVLLIDQTTGDPVKTRSMAQQLQALGMDLIDAPVSGGPAGAQRGDLAIMVGATADQYAHVMPILQCISPNVFHAGEVGTGHVAKLANNLVSAAHRMATLEALALADKNGVNPGTMTDILLASSGRNFFIETFVKSSIISGKLATGFSLNLMHKDIKLAAQLGVESGVPMFCTNTVREFFQVAMNMMGREAEVNTVALVMDKMAGTHVVPDDYTLTLG